MNILLKPPNFIDPQNGRDPLMLILCACLRRRTPAVIGIPLLIISVIISLPYDLLVLVVFGTTYIARHWRK